MNMIERVARGIAFSFALDHDALWDEAPPHLMGLKNWQRFVVQARRAIYDMREPTEAMVDAAYRNTDVGYSQCAVIWDYMIRAAMAEGAQ